MRANPNFDEENTGESTNSAAAAEAEQERVAEESKLAWIREQVASSVPVDGTPAEKYLADHRGLLSPYPLSLRWNPCYRAKPTAHARSCLLSVVSNEKGEVIALQSLELHLETGAKIGEGKRYSNGKVGQGAVALGISDSSVLVIGEGIETTFTRTKISGCDARACLGGVRYIPPEKYHKRIEILADTDKRDVARRLAREYANEGFNAYVVTVPDSLGPKADLNDLLRECGLTAVISTVEDAECIDKNNRDGLDNFPLKVGSDIEIAQYIIEQLEDIYGLIVVTEGRFWRFDRTHWIAFEADHLARFIHRADGTAFYDADGTARTVKLNKSRVSSVMDAMLKYRQQPDYFKSPVCGNNCETAFLQIHEDGSIEAHLHARKWRQRHLIHGKWYGDVVPSKWQDSLLNKFLTQAFLGDEDATKKIDLLSEVAGCAATGRGTRIRNPKAIVTFSAAGGTGKSTFLRLLRSLPNPEAVSSVPANKFNDEKYTFRLIGRVLNASDELPDKAIRSDMFKRVINGEPIPARDLYASAIDFVPVALHVFSTNVLPAFSGGIDGGTARRLLPIEFTHQVPEGERDPDMADNIVRHEADLLLYFAVRGACQLIRQRDFTVPYSCQLLLDEWLLTGDILRAWASEQLIVTEEENILSVAQLHSSFTSWAYAKDHKNELPNNIAFGKRLPTILPGLKRHRSNGSHFTNVKLRSVNAP